MNCKVRLSDSYKRQRYFRIFKLTSMPFRIPFPRQVPPFGVNELIAVTNSCLLVSVTPFNGMSMEVVELKKNYV